jgi:alpha,alpha-trehalose phosphorylase
MGTMMAPRAHARSGPEQPVDWSSPVGARIRVTSTRMVSLTQRAIAAISYTVEPVENGLRLVVQSDLVANEVPHPASRRGPSADRSRPRG